MSNRTKGILCILLSAFGFALMAMFVRLTDEVGGPISSMQKSFFRNVIACAIALVAFMRSAKYSLPKCRFTWTALVLRSVLGTGGIFANFYALSHVTIAEGQTLNKMAPFFTVLFAWLLLGERPTRRQVLAILLAFVGAMLIAKPGFSGALVFPLSMGLLGGFCAGGAYACVRLLGVYGVSGPFIVLFFSIFSCLASVPFMVVDFNPMTPVQILTLFGAGAGAAIGQFGITYAYRFAPPCQISVFDYSNILFTALFGLVLFGQIPDLWSITGFVVILFSAIYMSAKDGRVGTPSPQDVASTTQPTGNHDCQGAQTPPNADLS